jgi:3-hydroxyacyl-[acyl-carrier-protein] dehydratase
METSLAISPQHPAFPGHFPTAPILPGVVLLDEALYTIAQAGGPAAERCTLAWVKFRAVVRPGEALTLQHQSRADGSILFAIRCTDQVVADGLMTIAVSAAATQNDP